MIAIPRFLALRRLSLHVARHAASLKERIWADDSARHFTMHSTVIREAHSTEIPAIHRLTSQHVGCTYHWETRNRRRARDQLVLVAVDADDSICGAIGTGSPSLADINAGVGRNKSVLPPSHVRWWEVNVLTVDRSFRGQGIARELLRHTMRRLPRRHVGLYGRVAETRPESISWLRRQGFYIAPSSRLTSTERPADRGGIGLSRTPGEVYFRGYRSVVRDRLENRGRSDWETRTAKAEFDRQVKLYASGGNTSRDVGYRQYSQRISSEIEENSCVHASMGPRSMFVFGWDPYHQRVCADCVDAHLGRIEKYDAGKVCDGCGKEDTDTRMAFIPNHDRMLLIAAGLCSWCRSDGDFL